MPLHNRVLIKHLPEPRDGIWLPDEAGFLQRGIILEIGQDVRYCLQHDVVMFKTDESLRMRVPIEQRDPRGAFAKHGAMSVDEQPLPVNQTGSDTETLFLIPEEGIYLILERAA
jgi:hypothetical protein